MAETATSPQAPAVNAKKASPSQKKTKNPRSKPNHPPTSEMVNNAIKDLKERGGSSLQAIKKYITANYKVDAEKLSPFIKKYLKAAVASGGLVQTKGKGASGSFKLSSGTAVAKQAANEKKSAKPKAKSPKKSPVAAKAVKVSAKKSPAAASKGKTAATAAVSEKKPTVAAKARKAPGEKKVVKAPKSPSKAKRSNKVPTKKPKAPKPKRTKPTGGASTSKAAKKVAASPVKKK